MRLHRWSTTRRIEHAAESRRMSHREIARPQSLVTRVRGFLPSLLEQYARDPRHPPGNPFDRLVDPQPDRCIASDLRVVSEPLDKWCCRTCGAIRRRGSGGVANLFDANYKLYAHEPGRVEEARRQAGYARVACHDPCYACFLFRSGSGNCSPSLALHEHWSTRQ